MKNFRYSFLFTAICLFAAAYWGYARAGTTGALQALGIAIILGILETSLSFDNAVVNASIIQNWNRFWQTLFLTVGILIAVFGTRLLFPLLLVAQAADLALREVWHLVLTDPDTYSAHLTRHHAEMSVFGGIFLLMVFLNFLLDKDKELHWLGHPERMIGLLGRVPSIAIMIALSILLFTVSLLEESQKAVALSAGVWAILTYLAIDLIRNFWGQDVKSMQIGAAVKRGGIGGFLYLEVLDSTFSFDGVIGAFAITNDAVIIMLGLSIGAIFVRSMTVFLVRQGTLGKYVFLHHGAHYAIGVLGVIMLISIKFHVPELLTGSIGLGCILASFWSSIRYRTAQFRKQHR